MKTNSHSPVDGDVQALIEHIKKWKEGSTFFDSVVEFNKRQSQIYEIALAALTAEPDGFRVRNKKISRDNEIYDARFTGEKCINNTLQPEDYELYAIYRKPPADSVRHMLMPKVVGEIPEYGEVISKAHLIHALRQQGIEVKE